LEIGSYHQKWQVHPDSGNCPYQIHIEDDEEIITLINTVASGDDVLKYRYNFDGAFLDADKMRADTLHDGSPYALNYLYEEDARTYYKTPMSALPEMVNDLIELTNREDIDSKLRAKIF
jgi:hypothetical protein